MIRDRLRASKLIRRMILNNPRMVARFNNKRKLFPKREMAANLKEEEIKDAKRST